MAVHRRDGEDGDVPGLAIALRQAERDVPLAAVFVFMDSQLDRVGVLRRAGSRSRPCHDERLRALRAPSPTQMDATAVADPGRPKLGGIG